MAICMHGKKGEQIMAINFTTTKNASQVSGVKVLVYGKAGSGKTYLCSTAPAPIIISIESGLLSLRNYDLPVIEIETMDDLREAYELVTSKKGDKFKTICIDSLSEIAEVILFSAKKRVKDNRQAYGDLLYDTMKMVKRFRDLKGKNVYFSAKEIKIVDSITDTVLFAPSMPGTKLGPQLPYYFDEVFRLTMGTTSKGKTKRYFQTASDYQCEAKDRSGALDEHEKPNLTYIFNKILED